jgi:hypothetical protein
MTDSANLERGYRRWLRCYPRSFRREHEAEIIAVLMAGAREGQRQPEPLECLDLLRGALWVRLRPSVPRSNRSTLAAVKLMYVAGLVEIAPAITILATIGDARLQAPDRAPVGSLPGASGVGRRRMSGRCEAPSCRDCG